MNSHPTPSPSVPLFALIIGINDYDSQQLGHAYNLRPLKGAVADAQSFKRWLRWRGVPTDHIVLLTNEKATCSEIIHALTNLETDTRIRPGNPIFIYYAGHGTEIKGPESWECGRADKMIQAIVPYDCDTELESGELVGPIADRTFGALIGNIARQKGNNIFVVLDCCHSGSGTRGKAAHPHDDDNQDRARAADLRYNYSTILERQLRDTGVHELTSSMHNRFIHYAMESHVLISACGQKEEAFETAVQDDIYTTKRGRFSMALLKLLYEMPLDKLVYSDIPLYIDKIPNQNPQCAGKHADRFIFNSKILPAQHKGFAVAYEEGINGQAGQYILHAGTIQKVTSRSKFALFEKFDVNLTRLLGTLSATENKIREFSSHATVTPIDNNFRKMDIVAVRVKGRAEDNLKIFIAPSDKLLSIYKKLQHDLEDVVLEKDPETANIEITTVTEGKVSFTFRSLPHPRLSPFKWKQVVDIDVSRQAAELVHFLSKTAHFYRELKLADNDSDISSNVEVKFFKLKPLGDNNFEPVRAENFCKDGIVTVVHDPDALYGIELVNKTKFALYANLFYFINKDLSIEKYVVTTPHGDHNCDPCLQPHTGTFAVGWGAAGHAPLYCDLDEGEQSNIEFLKIYLSTQPVNLAYLPQLPLFSSARGMRRYYAPPPKYWTDLVIPIVMYRRLGNVNAGRRN